MKKFWKCSTGSLHGATYFERPTVGKKSTRVTTRNSSSTAITSGGIEITANDADAGAAVEPAVSSVRAVHAERHGDQQADDDRPEGDEHRRRHPLLEHLDVRLAGHVRVAPVTGEDVLQPVHVLHRQRVVEVRVVRLDLRDLLLGDEPAREIAGGIRRADPGDAITMNVTMTKTRTNWISRWPR